MTDIEKALEALDLLQKRAYSHAEKSNGPKEMREWIDKDAATIRTTLTDKARLESAESRLKWYAGFDDVLGKSARDHFKAYGEGV